MRAKCFIGILILSLAVGTYRAQEKQKSEQKPSSGSAAAAPAAPQAPRDYKISPEDAARKNPVRFTEGSVSRGKKLFLNQCAMCHGQKADGKGELAADMQIAPPDFTIPEILKKRADGELFMIIAVGSDTMPGQGKRMLDKHRWDIVNFLRAASGKQPEKSDEKEEDARYVIVPTH